MKLKNYNVYFFFLILIAVTVASFFLVKALLAVLIVAAILAHSFMPFYEKTLKWTGGRKGISSGLICLLVALIIFIPLILIGFLLYAEIQVAILNFSSDPGRITFFIDSFNNTVHSFSVFGKTDVLGSLKIDSQTVSASLNNLVSLIQGIYKGVGYWVLMTFIFFFCLFYLLIDGKRIVQRTMELSPLKDKYEKTLMDKFYSISRATIKGTFFVSAIHGFIGAVVFFLLGISFPIILGIFMMIAAIIPGVGAGVAWFAIGLVIILLGYFSKGLLIIVIGMPIIFFLDNILRPKIIGRDSKMHPILILLSTLGGIEFFGIYGFIIGPLLMSFCVALWEIYFLEFKKQLKGFNKS